MRITRMKTVLKLDTTSAKPEYKEVQQAVSEDDTSLDSLGTDSLKTSSDLAQKIKSNDFVAQLAQSLSNNLSEFGAQQQNQNQITGKNLNTKA